MTAAEIAQLEAVRTVCLAALTAARGALQTVEAMILTHDRTDPEPDANPWDTFDSTTPEVSDERQKASKRR